MKWSQVGGTMKVPMGCLENDGNEFTLPKTQ